MKPDARIYQAGMRSLNVSAKESLYMDDYDIEANGARHLGMTSFHLIRDSECKANWDISSLTDMIAYVKSAGKDCIQANKPL